MKINSTIKIYQFNKKNINEISIGETFIMDGIKYTAQKREDFFCSHCAFCFMSFCDQCASMKCLKESRKDRTDIIFKKIIE